MTFLQKSPLIQCLGAFSMAALFCAATASCLFLWERQQEKADRDRLTSPGAFTAIGPDKRLLRTKLEGRPTSLPPIIFQNGLAATLESWSQIQSQLAAVTQTVAFDRAGIGFSDASAGLRDAAAISDELVALERALELDRPAVLICHSIAGPYCLVFAHAHPERVAGVLLVDPHHPDETLRVSPDAAEEDRKLFEVYPPSLFRRSLFGLTRLRSAFEAEAAVGDETGIDRAVRLSSRHWRGVDAEGSVALGPTLSEARIAMGDFPAIPVSVLSASIPVTANRPIVRDLQRGLVSKGPVGRHEVVQDTSHEGLLATPAGVEAVVRASLELLHATRSP